MERADNKSDFVGFSIKIPKAKMMKSKHSLEYKHGDAPKKFLNPLRDWIQSDKVRNMRHQGYLVGVGGKTEKYEDNSDQFMRAIENMVITFYLYKPQSQPYQKPHYQQGQGQKPVSQPTNVVQEDNDPMDDQIPDVDQPPF
jgi:hypothetical protein